MRLVQAWILSMMIPSVTSNCGATYELEEGVVISPNYPNHYDHNADCYYLIRMPPGAGNPTLTFTNFGLEWATNCVFHYLEIYDGGNDLAPLLGRFCGSNIPGPFVASTSQIYLKFHTDASGRSNGFRAAWGPELDNCGSTKPCENGGSCSSQATGGNFSCTCTAGYTGHSCSIEINECESNPCVNGGTCHDLRHQFFCICPQAYTGETCGTEIDECASSPCGAHGNCTDLHSAFSCICNPGYTGITCASDIDECVTSPCLNGGRCADLINSFTCSCTLKYTGYTCNITLNDCLNHTCQNGATCIDQHSSYKCICQPGYSGEYCEAMTQGCVAKPCQNGGSCLTYQSGAYKCDCAEGFNGINCETDIDDCSSSSCMNGGTCSDLPNGFNCTCPSGYTGRVCQTDIEDCRSLPCLNGGNCTDGIDEYTCACDVLFGGKNCQIKLHVCAAKPCSNGGTCLSVIDHGVARDDGSYHCICAQGFAGNNCSIDIDDCPTSSCQNGGSCLDRPNGYVCLCVGACTGPRCEYCDAASCDATYELYEGVVTSPNYPNHYDHNADCYILIKMPPGAGNPTLTFTNFGLESTPDCVFDYLVIYDGGNDLAPRLGGRFCGTYIPGPFVASTSQIYLKFHTDGFGNSNGFRATWGLVVGVPVKSSVQVRTTKSYSGSSDEDSSYISYIDLCIPISFFVMPLCIIIILIIRRRSTGCAAGESIPSVKVESDAAGSSSGEIEEPVSAPVKTGVKRKTGGAGPACKKGKGKKAAPTKEPAAEQQDQDTQC